MPSIVSLSKIAEFNEQEVKIRGWVRRHRSKGKLQFLTIRDGAGELQAILSKADMDEEQFKAASHLTQESSIEVTGTVRADERAPGGYELDVSHIRIIHLAEEFPIQPKEHGTGFLMDHRHLWLRSSRQQAILKIRHEIVKACRDFFDDRDFVLMDTPIFTPNACEGTTTLFQTQYFEEKAFLTQSGQLYNEATAAAFGKVYCFGPTFRAEKSKTRRHLMEFWMVEPEVAFAELPDVMELAEDFLVMIVQRVLEKRQEELKVLERDVSKLEAVTPPFPRLTYRESIERLQKNGSAIQGGDDFGAEDETILSNEHQKPLIVHRYPSAIKAFYMEADPEQPDLALCMDVLAPEGYGEIIGGGQRVHDYEKLASRLKEHQLSEDAFKWYLDLRRYGSVPHAGFGMGIERAVAWICGLDHVRETIPFPRMLNRLYP
ncbi:MAG: asparagine--tRNA ligase [Nitrospirae bacterium]|nr:asparagine--tRNA ligase [Nitrospirota bacterium]MDA1303685.1 asparagine--tRNA ligase [Nitrospirota bacterium]